MSADILHVAWINPVVYTDGPGKRTSVAVQGCSIRCQGCQVPQTWRHGAGSRMAVDEVVGQLLDTGLPVTILGGEPFDQAPAVAQIVRACHDAGRHVIVYTGNIFEDLVRRARKEPAIQAILAHADVLVDGPFMADRDHAHLQYRGSANQRPIDLDVWRETGEVSLLDWDTTVDVTILADGSILVPEGYAIDLESLVGCASVPARRCGEGL